MKGRRYPLQALQTLRNQELDRRALAVAAEAERTREAEARARAAVDARRAHTNRVAEALDHEAERLSAGQLCAADLALQAAWERAEQARIRELSEREAAALRDATVQQRTEAGERAQLAQADADAEAVEQHRARWAAERAAKLEAAAEEAMDDVATARYVRERRS